MASQSPTLTTIARSTAYWIAATIAGILGVTLAITLQVDKAVWGGALVIVGAAITAFVLFRWNVSWWARAVTLLVMWFSGYFIFTEAEGLVRLFTWTVDGLASIPASLEAIVTHYTTVPFAQVAASMLVGAAFGMVMTPIVLLIARRVIEPRISAYVWLSALAVGVAVLVLTGYIAAAIIACVVVLIALGQAIDTSGHYRLLSAHTLRKLGTRRTTRMIATGALIGAVTGVIGSQIVALPTQHCTYGPEAPFAETQIGLVVTAVGTLFLLFPVWTVLRRGITLRNQATSGYFRGFGLPMIFLLPTLASLILFLYYPSLQTVNLSLFSRRFPLPNERFVCLGNYTALFEDTIYQNSFFRTGLITVAIVLLSMSLALAIATLASQKIRFAGVYRTLLIWPFALSPVVAGVIFLALFREGNVGLINYAIEQVFGTTLSWLRNADLAPLVIILTSAWNILGFNILFYIAGLQNVPPDLLEAAAIDGANKPQRFFRITFPLLAPYTFFLLVTNVTYSFYGIYGAVDTLTDGGPPLGPAGSLGGATDVLIYKLYEDAFNPGAPVGLAGAQALILFVIVAGITLLQFRYLESRITYGA